MEMDIVDQYTIWLECFNHDMMETDQLIGNAQCSLLPVFKRGELVFPHSVSSLLCDHP